MKKIIIILLLFYTPFLYSQENYVKNKWKVKFSYLTFHSTYEAPDNSSSVNSSHFQADLSYGVLSYLETGVYFGYSTPNSNMILNDKNSTFGLTANFHFFHFIAQGKLLRHIDTYVATNIGANHHKTDDINSFYTNKKVLDGANTFYLECGIGVGAAIYIKKLGIFTEYSFGKYFYKDNKRLRFGLVYRF